MSTTFSDYVPQRWAATGVGLIAMAVGMFLLHKTFAQDTSAGEVSALALLLAATWAVGGLLMLWLFRHGPKAAPVAAPGHRLWPVALMTSVLCVGSLIGAYLFYESPILGTSIRAATATTTESRLLVLGVALLAGAAEEIFFRVGLHRLWPKEKGPFMATMAYVVATVATGNIALIVMAAILGAVCSLALRMTGRAIVPIMIHAAWTLTMVGLFPSLIST